LVLVAAALLLMAQQAQSVPLPLRWRWSNPAPHGGNVVDMAYSATLGLAVQVAEGGQIYTSDDLILWLPRSSGVTNALRGVTFLGTRLIITGESGCVLYSDNGTTFRPGTLLTGSTEDWLEAVTVSGSLAVAVGDNGAVYTSGNGVSWSRRNSGTAEWLRGVAFGNGGFVAAGEYGTILTSNNGTNWTNRVSGTTRHLNRVSFAGGRFTVVGDEGTTLVSDNGGFTWWPESSGATNALHHAATGGNNRLMVGASEVRLHNGLAWSNELVKPNGPPDWTYYSCLGRSDFFLIAGQTGLQSEGYQTDTNSFFWIEPYASVRNWLWDVIYATNLYVTVGDFGTVMTSGNGVDWVLEYVPNSVANTTLLGVGGTTNMLVAVGDSGAVIVSPNQIADVITTNDSGVVSTQSQSSLGVIWHEVPRPTTNDLQGVTTLSNELFVITGGGGKVFTSGDGTNWTQRSTPVTKFLSSATEFPGGLVATGDDGTILTSPNAVTWTRRTASTTNWLYRVRYLNGVLLAVGQNGTILTSSNGVNWSKRTSGTAKWLTDATFVDDTWFVFGYSGTVLTSTNLATWSPQGMLTKKALYGCATDGDQLIAVGVEGAILRAQVLPDLTPIEFLAYSHVATPNPALTQNVYLFGGRTDQLFALERRTDFTKTNWLTSALLEIFDGSGTLYYVETVLGTNQPATEFYRATLLP
jgi:hypothetical protein